MHARKYTLSLVTAITLASGVAITPAVFHKGGSWQLSSYGKGAPTASYGKGLPVASVRSYGKG
jgi:hypothetical protein